jgi:CopG family nickel-responsive transcriptional regulator
MSEIVRFSISLNRKLLTKFDQHIKERDYPTRSKAIEDLIREELIKKEWQEGEEVAGVISLVYNHHKRDLINTLNNIQHDFYQLIISTQHIHLDHENCLEIIAVKGKPKKIERLAYKLKTTKGIKHSFLTMTTTGDKI